MIVATVNDESLEGLKFGESAKKSIWRKKVWQISPRILVVYNISYMLANKVWQNITIRQTFVVYGICLAYSVTVRILAQNNFIKVKY